MYSVNHFEVNAKRVYKKKNRILKTFGFQDIFFNFWNVWWQRIRILSFFFKSICICLNLIKKNPVKVIIYML